MPDARTIDAVPNTTPTAGGPFSKALLPVLLALGTPIVGGTSSTTAAPVVVWFEEGTQATTFGDDGSGMPRLVLDSWPVIGGGQVTTYPRLYPQGYDIGFCLVPPFPVEQATDDPMSIQRYDRLAEGETVGPAIDGWATAFNCFDFDIAWPAMITRFTGFNCALPGCPPEQFLDKVAPEGLSFVPIRIGSTPESKGESENDPSGGDLSWHYAWLAFRFENLVIPDCSRCAAEPPVDLLTADWSFVAFGYETEPDTPIANGGGLCPADLTGDNVLDTADLTAFVTAFLADDPIADFDNDGIFDLGDIVAFVLAFNAGCGL